MKSRILIALPLAAALMAPAYAQQGNSNNSTQGAPAATQDANQTSTAAAQQPAAQEEAAHQPLQAERHEGFWGKLNPMARKKYVQRQMDPVRGRVNELDELTSANTKNIKDVDARAQEGIRLASARANEADQHAVDAGNRAQAANQLAEQTSTRLQTVQQVVTNLDQYQPTAQTEIRLRPGQSTLSKKAKEALDQLAEQTKGQNGYLIEVQGFSSGQGAAAIESSRTMAESVVRYLVINHEIPVYRIYQLGMGNYRPTPAQGEAKTARGPRVEISLLKNPNLDQLTSSTASSGQGLTGQGGTTGMATQSAAQHSASAGSTSNAPAASAGTPGIQSRPGQTTPAPRE